MGETYKFKFTNAHERYWNNNWGIYEVFSFDKLPHQFQGNVTLVGNIQKLDPNLEYTVEAELVRDKRFGYQYKASSGVRIDKPKTVEQMKMFLKALVTDNQAETLASLYPNLIEDVVTKNFDIDYNKTKGIKQKTWKRIKDKIIENYAISDLLAMLIPLGITYNQIQKMLTWQTNPSLLQELIMDNPYVLTNVSGIGFKKCDKFALKIKPDIKESKERTKAFLKYTLRQMGQDEGHTYIDVKKLAVNVKTNIPECFKIFTEMIKSQKEQSTFLHINGRNIGLKSYREKEKACIEKIIKIQQGDLRPISESQIEEAINESNAEQGFEFTDEQKRIIEEVARSKFAVLTAKAGAGKSVSSRGILKLFAKSNMSIAVTAFTARASKRAEEATGFSATTIHRLLGSSSLEDFQYNENNFLPYDVILLDEAGMVSVDLMYNLLSAISPNTIFIMVGDGGQLDPISYGCIFEDICNREDVFNIKRLTKVMRQARESGILSDANKVREGKNPISKDEMSPMVSHGAKKDNTYIFRDNKEDLHSIGIATYMKFVKNANGNTEDVVIMTPTRKKINLNSAEKLSLEIQQRLLGHEEKFIKVMGEQYKLGAKVMHIKNNKQKEIYNGDIGFIKEIGKDEYNKPYCIVDYGEKIGSKYYSQGEFADLTLAYALSIHKLQGSGIKNTIIIIDDTHRIMLNNKLFYTAITRSKQKNIVLSTERAFKWALNIDDSIRNTWTKLELDEWLKGEDDDA